MFICATNTIGYSFLCSSLRNVPTLRFLQSLDLFSQVTRSSKSDRYQESVVCGIGPGLPQTLLCLLQLLRADDVAADDVGFEQNDDETREPVTAS